MKKNILVISTCEEKLHELEFVKPIVNILSSEKVTFFVKHYKEIKEKDLEECSKIIICGTSLKDNKFVDDLEHFGWLRDFEKPALGICAGMQIIGLTFKGRLRKKTEIGFFGENFKKSFLGLKGEQEVFHLHNNFVESGEEFEIFCKSKKIQQAVKHKRKEFYGVLFHPEVRNKNLILEFLKK